MNPGDLKHRIEIWGKVKILDVELNEMTFQPLFIKKVWAEIIPTSSLGSFKNGQANTIYTESTSRIKIRKSAFSELRSDNWITFKGHRFDIKYVQPDYKNNSFFEIFCQEVIE